MSYIEAHRAELALRHYIQKALTSTHWYNFQEDKLDNYRHQYGDNFCLIINCSLTDDVAYILPFKDVKEFFCTEYLDGKRWSGTVLRDNIRVSVPGKPTQELHTGHLLNAFELIQDAPQPLPPKPGYN